MLKKITKLLTITLLATGLPLFGEDIRTLVGLSESRNDLIIEVGERIYDFPIGMTEDEFIAKKGKPVGYLRIDEVRTAMLYGRKHAFLFKDKKLDGVRISHGIVDWKLSNQLRSDKLLDASTWRLTNGVYEGMTLEELEEVLADNLKTDRYLRYFDVGNSRVELGVRRYQMSDTENAKETVSDIYIYTKYSH